MSTRRTDEDFSQEVHAHLELEIARLVEDGMTPADARAAALRAFGNVGSVKERFYEANRWMWLEQIVQDLRYGWRGLRRSPAFLATTVLTLAVGLSLTTIVFSVFNAYVLRPFAVRDPASLHQIGWRSSDNGGQSFRWQDYGALRERAELFESVIAEDTRFVSSNRRNLATAFVSDNYFDSLAPRLLLGRSFNAFDADAPVAVLSHQAWSRLFAGDRTVVGRELELDGHPFTIVGVAAPAFTGIDDMPLDVWVPFSTYATVIRPDLLPTSQLRRVEVIARLRSGVTASQAQAALTPLMARLVETTSDRKTIRADVRSRSTPNPLSLELLAVLSPVFAAFALVLLAACANVSNVMLSRAIARHREIAVRLSLGASRGRVIRQLLTEGLLIAVLAGAVALLLASWALRGGVALLFGTLPPALATLLRVVPLDFDRRVFLFALLVSAATTLLFAFVPALQASRLALTDALKGERSGTRHGSRLRSALVIGQVAVSLILVVTAITLGKNGAAVAALDPGFDPAGVISINIRTRAEEGRLIGRLATVLAPDPRVATVAVSSGNPFFIRSRPVAAAPDRPGVAAVPTRHTFVSPEYFTLLRIPFTHGRGFRQDEAASAAPVAIVSEATAKAFWPGEDPVNRRIRFERPNGRPVEELPDQGEVTVVGVASDVISGFLVDGRDAGHIYLPIGASSPRARALLLRPRSAGELGPQALQPIFKQLVSDPQLFEAIPLHEVRDVQIYPMSAAAWIGAALGGIALLLSVTGLYGVLSYTLNQRTREIGIRMALGATAAAVVRLVMEQSARLAGVGAAIGLAITFAALKALSAVVQFPSVSLLDGAAFGGGLLLVFAATAFAAWHPARRATRVNPAVTLRADA
jgi:predicted permease